MVERLLEIIKKKGLSASAVEKRLGFGNGAIRRFSTNSPSVDKIIALSNFLNVSVEYILFGTENVSEQPEDVQILVTYYKQLSERDKGIILGKAEALAELAAERAAEQAKKATKSVERAADEEPMADQTDPQEPFYVDICSLPTSAGTGIYLDDVTTEPLQIERTPIAEAANYAVRVSGDSMETAYSDGDIVLVKTCPSVEIGEIGIFIVNGEGYIKKLGKDRLISLNPEYDDVPLHEEDTIYCRGRVLGKAIVVK